MRFTAAYIEAENGWIVGYIEELQGVHAQGRTVEETRENLREVLRATLEINREDRRKAFAKYRVVLRERLS